MRGDGGWQGWVGSLRRVTLSIRTDSGAVSSVGDRYRSIHRVDRDGRQQ